MTNIPQVVKKHEAEILAQWLSELAGSVRRADLMADDELKSQSRAFLSLFNSAVQSGNVTDMRNRDWASVRDMIADFSRSRVQQGFSPSDVASYVLSLKKPIFNYLRQEAKSADELAAEVWTLTEMLDQLALHSMEMYQKSREEVIARQQQEMLELSTPVVKLWDRILALPLIGTLDSQRTQVVMGTLLQEVVSSGAEVAIIDITGVPTVDTLVAQHLLKTVTAARLMGAECIISGIRPQTAQTIVHLGVDLGDIVTKATLADAFRLSLVRLGLRITSADKKSRAAGGGSFQNASPE